MRDFHDKEKNKKREVEVQNVKEKIDIQDKNI